MLGTAARPERISLAIPKERIDYTEVSFSLIDILKSFKV